MKSAIQDRFFIVGCARSGTTLLQSLLAAHSRIASFPETMFFSDLVGQWDIRWFGETPCPRRRLRNLLHDLRVRAGIAHPMGRMRVYAFLNEIGANELKALFPAAGFSLKEQIDACIAILDRLAERQGKPYWIEKSPTHLGYMDIIEKYVGPVKFIHILRSGPDVVASLTDVVSRFPGTDWCSQYDTVEKRINQWNHAVRLSANYSGHPNHKVIAYERLVTETPAVLQELCRFLGVPYDRTMLEDYGETAEKVILEKEGWKANNRDRIQNANATKFYALFNEEERAYIERRLIPLPESLAVVASDRSGQFAVR